MLGSSIGYFHSTNIIGNGGMEDGTENETEDW